MLYIYIYVNLLLAIFIKFMKIYELKFVFMLFKKGDLPRESTCSDHVLLLILL